MMSRITPDVEIIPEPEVAPVRVMTANGARAAPPTNGNGGNGGNGNGSDIKVTINPLLLFVIVALLYVSLNLWAKAGEKFIFQGLFRGRELSWWQLVLISLAVTGLAILIVWLGGVSLIQLEREI